jgi:hypothetical protein
MLPQSTSQIKLLYPRNYIQVGLPAIGLSAFGLAAVGLSAFGVSAVGLSAVNTLAPP